MENAFIVTAVVAATEFLRRVNVRDWFAAVSILVSALIGGLAGYFHLAGTANFEAGLLIGLGASGLVTVANRVGGGTTARQVNNNSLRR